MKEYPTDRKTRRKPFASAVILAALGVILAGGEALAQTTKAPQPSICNRSCWNATSNGLPSTTGLNRAIIHHTAGAYGNQSLSHSRTLVRNIQSYHKSIGWLDIGYHFLTDALGNIFQGRHGSMASSTYYRGAHDGTNASSYGYSALGNYQNNTFTTNGRNAMWDVIAWRMPGGWSPYGSGTYNGKTVGRTAGHLNVKATACPGTNIYNTIGTNFSGGTARNAIAARRTPSGGATVTVDNHHSGFSASGSWATATAASDKLGPDYRWRSTTAVSDPASWTGNLPSSGSYRVDAWWSAGANRSTAAPYIVHHSGGGSPTHVQRNQQINGGKWRSLGTFSFSSGNRTVQLSCWAPSGFVVIADGVRWVQQ